MFLIISAQVLSSKLHFGEDIFIRICLSTHRKGTVNHLNPAYSHSLHSHIYSKSAHSSTVPRLSFYWFLDLHCVVKWILPSRDPACHSTNNKSNKHRQRPVCFFLLSFLDADAVSLDLFTAQVLLEQTQSVWNATVRSHSDKAWKDIAFLFFLCSTASTFMVFLFFFAMPWLFSNRNTTAWGSGAQRWHCTAAHDARETIVWN